VHVYFGKLHGNDDEREHSSQPTRPDEKRLLILQ